MIRPDVTGTVAFPDVTVEFSPFTDPLDVPVWIDITQHLRSFSINRGRQDELSRVEAGTATFVMDNYFGQFDPTNTAGPYFGGIRPMRQIRIQAWTPPSDHPFYVGDSFVGGPEVLGASVYGMGLFSGFVESWEQDWTPQPSYSPDATMTIHAVDAFIVLGKIGAIPINSETVYSGYFIDQALGLMWPNAPRNIANGLNAIDWVASASEALSVFQEVDASEGGLFFAARDGTITFYDRQRLALNPPTTAMTWGDALDERQYQNIGVSHDETTVVNVVTVLASDGSGIGTAQDNVSQSRYIYRRETVDTMLAASQPWNGQQRAIEIIARQSSPYLRVTSMEVGVRDDIEWADVLSRDLGDRITVKRRPLRTEPGIVQDSTIQRITIQSASRWHWSVVWTLTATVKPNMLSANQASFISTVGNWAAVSNCTLSWIGTQSYDFTLGSSGRMRMTSVAAGDISAHAVPVDALPVTPGHIYTAGAYYGFEQSNPPRLCHTEIRWLTSALALISTWRGNSLVNGISAVTAVAPPTAAYAEVLVVIEAAGAAGERFGVDAVHFVEGEQTGFTPGTG